jgi:YHS domain-containing protein
MVVLFGFGVWAQPVVAQTTTSQAPAHEHPAVETPHQEHAAMTGPLGITRARTGSGTAWLPDLTPMYAIHRPFGGWNAMLHENLFLQYVHEGTERGDDQLGSVNWIMGMAERRAAGGFLGLRTMFSVERLTVGTCGYPDLLATGESCNGQPIHDRQHPHDFFMEAAGIYERELSSTMAVQLYAGLAGEPALGPVAFPHRVSALSTPIAPLTHHWLDSTHITYGVVSGGLFGTRWKAEASVFNGREPDENRFDMDFGALDSYAGRLWFAPSDRWSVQISKGRLNEAEADPHGGPRRNVGRTTASATYHQLIGSAGFWSVTGAWGRNAHDGHATDALLLETDLALDARNTLFARAEGAGKTGEELIIPEIGHDAVTVSKLHLGYARQLPGGGMFEPRVGAALSFSAIPERAEQAYGRGSGVGVLVFFSLRPGAMAGLRGTPVAAAPAVAPAGPHAGHAPPPAAAAAAPHVEHAPAPAGAAAAAPHAEHAPPPAGVAAAPHAEHVPAPAAAGEPAAPAAAPGVSLPQPPAASSPGADPHAGHVATAPPAAATPRAPAAAARPRTAARPSAPAAADAHAGHAAAPAAPTAAASAERPAPPPASATRAAVAGPPTDIAELKCTNGVDPKTAPRMLYQGRMYYFCSNDERAQFAKDPGRYVTAPPAAAAPHAH